MDTLINIISNLNKTNSAFVVATIVKAHGSTPRGIGAKMIILKDGSTHGTIGGGELELNTINDGKKCLLDNESKTISYALTQKEGHLCGGGIEVFFEVHGSVPDIFIFGAGHVGYALCKVLEDTPFNVHLIDEREERMNRETLGEKIILHNSKWETFIDKNNFQTAYTAIMTPKHEKDEFILEKIINKTPSWKYLGLMGSQKKWEEMRSHLNTRNITNDTLNKVCCPIGVKTGGKTPAEIAVSIAAEILKTHYGY